MKNVWGYLHIILIFGRVSPNLIIHVSDNCGGNHTRRWMLSIVYIRIHKKLVYVKKKYIPNSELELNFTVGIELFIKYRKKNEPAIFVIHTLIALCVPSKMRCKHTYVCYSICTLCTICAYVNVFKCLCIRKSLFLT